MNERRLLDDPDVRRWYDNLSRGSLRTADEYLRWLNDYCSSRGVDPNHLIDEFKQDKKTAQDRLEDYIRSLEKNRGLKPKSLNGALCAVKNWFKWFELEVTRQIKVGNVRSTPTIQEEHPPSPEELNTILDHGNQRTRAAIVLIAYAGIRPEAISRLKWNEVIALVTNEKVKTRDRRVKQSEPKTNSQPNQSDPTTHKIALLVTEATYRRLDFMARKDGMTPQQMAAKLLEQYVAA
jgi:integrase